MLYTAVNVLRDSYLKSLWEVYGRQTNMEVVFNAKPYNSTLQS